MVQKTEIYFFIVLQAGSLRSGYSLRVGFWCSLSPWFANGRLLAVSSHSLFSVHSDSGVSLLRRMAVLSD